MIDIPEQWLDEAEMSLLASGYTPNEDLVDQSEWSARQVAEIVLTDRLIGMIWAGEALRRDREAWLDEHNRTIDDRDAALAREAIERSLRLTAEAERDAARAEVERLRSPEWEAEVRADERRRIADAISDQCAHQLAPGGPCYRCRESASIARDGGRP